LDGVVGFGGKGDGDGEKVMVLGVVLGVRCGYSCVMGVVTVVTVLMMKLSVIYSMPKNKDLITRNLIFRDPKSPPPSPPPPPTSTQTTTQTPTR
jgi:hypothetical protein